MHCHLALHLVGEKSKISAIMPPANRPVRTVYANFVNIQTSETELILEFGAVFPSDEKTEAEVTPEVRIVLPKAGAEEFIDYIQAAIDADSEQSASNRQGRTGRRRAK